MPLLDSVQFVPCQDRNSDLVIGCIAEKDFANGRRMMFSLVWWIISIFTCTMYQMAFLVIRQGFLTFL